MIFLKHFGTCFVNIGIRPHYQLNMYAFETAVIKAVDIILSHLPMTSTALHLKFLTLPIGHSLNNLLMGLDIALVNLL